METTRATVEELADAAAALASTGLAVFPCLADKRPATQHGFKDATTDPAAAKRLFLRCADAALVGVATGEISGLDALDIDLTPHPESGEWITAHPPPATRTHRTRSGGLHYLFRHKDGVGNRAGKPVVGVDVRGTGGYIIWWPAAGFPHSGGILAPWPQFHYEQCFAPPPAPAPTAAPRAAPPPRGNGHTAALDTYVDAALHNEANRVAGSREGTRNTTLNNAALALGHLVGAGVLARRDVEATLERAADACGLWRDGPAGVRATIKSGLDAGIAQPADLSHVGARARPVEAPAREVNPDTLDVVEHEQFAETGELEVSLAQYEQNDLGNARRLVERFGADFRAVKSIGWHAWDGRRWVRDEEDVYIGLASHKTAKLIFSEIAFLQDADDIKARAKWAIASGNSPRLSGMIREAGRMLSLSVDDLDRDRWLLNCENGTVDLRTGTMRPHDRKDLITRLVPVTYDPRAKAPTWHRFLNEIFAGDEATIEFVQKALGYSLTGITRERVLFILHGSGSNGKSVLLETVAAILADYARQSPSDTFTAKDKGSGGVSNDIARLLGARMVSIVETEQERRLAEGLVKQATGEDRMAARYLHHEFFEFLPQFKIWLATNHVPKIRGTDEGIWSRIKLIPFRVRFWEPGKAPPGERTLDATLRDKLALERPGILAWMVEGSILWQRDGIPPSVSIETATTDYRASQDPIADWVIDRCDLGSSYSCRFSWLYDDYKKWCAENGDNHIGSRNFADRLGEKGHPMARAHAGVKMRKGIDLKEEFKPYNSAAQE